MSTRRRKLHRCKVLSRQHATALRRALQALRDTGKGSYAPGPWWPTDHPKHQPSPLLTHPATLEPRFAFSVVLEDERDWPSACIMCGCDSALDKNGTCSEACAADADQVLLSLGVCGGCGRYGKFGTPCFRPLNGQMEECGEFR